LTRFSRIVENIPQVKKRKRKLISFRKSNLRCFDKKNCARIVESIPEGNKRKQKFISFRKSNQRCFDEKNCADLRKYSGKAETETNLLALHIVFHDDLSLRNRSEAVDRYRCH
jgi:hypothetical protein